MQVTEVLLASLLFLSWTTCSGVPITSKQSLDKNALLLAPGSLLEGDIILDKSLVSLIEESIGEKGKNSRTRREVSKDMWRKWEKGVVPFVFGKGIDHNRRRLIKKAVRIFNKQTCISLKQRNKEKDYINFVFGIGCYSNIGRQGGAQEISLGHGCDTLGHVLHELMHTIGFLHEHSRYDRDKYVKVHWDNILPGKEVHFATYSHGELDHLDAPYDIASIMHYGKRAFSRNGKPSITAKKNPIIELGGNALSDIDIKQINWLYRCPKWKNIQCYDRHPHCRKVRKHPKYCLVLQRIMAQFCAASCHFC